MVRTKLSCTKLCGGEEVLDQLLKNFPWSNVGQLAHQDGVVLPHHRQLTREASLLPQLPSLYRPIPLPGVSKYASGQRREIKAEWLNLFRLLRSEIQNTDKQISADTGGTVVRL